MPSTFTVDEWTPIAKNTLRGFCRVRTPAGLIFHDVAVHKRDDTCWASPSSKPHISRDGVQLKGADGKGLWTPVVTFTSKELRDRFSNQVIDALLARDPDALT
jgi:hypothetical protein